MLLNNRVDFKHIAPRNGSHDEAFEEFCCQIARHANNVPAGSEFVRYRGAGGDGGVECIWRLPNGDEWGWQVKYIFDLSQAKRALDESVSTAIRVHPNLKRYIICLPFDLTGPTDRKTKGGRKTRSQSEYFDEYREGWERAALAANVNLKILLATPTSLLDDLHSFDPHHGRLRYWFNATVLSDAWFSNHLEEAKASAYPRYTPELRIQTPIAEAFEAIGLTDEWFASLVERVRGFKKVLDQWKRSVASTNDRGWGAVFPEALRPDGERVYDLLSSIAEQYRRFVGQRDVTINLAGLETEAVQTLRLLRELRTALAADLEAKHGEGTADSVPFRQWQSEFQGNFPASNVDAAGEAISFLNSFIDWVTAPITQLPKSSYLLIVGQAGVGKTHVICDVAELRAARQLRTLVLFGERFSGATEPWEQIKQQLGLDATLDRDSLLAALDAAGEASGKPLLLCIDGLNETKPRTFWRNHLPSMLTHLRRYPSIRLCISCRTTYESQVIPEIFSVSKIVHEGFSGIEFDACRAFFQHYKLEPPVTPILQPEFANPLFLTLVCETMIAVGHKHVPTGWYGINTAINAFVRAKNLSYGSQHDLLPSYHIPEDGLKAFIEVAQARQQTALPWSVARQAIESIVPLPHNHGPLIDWLVREGLLIVDAAPSSADNLAEDYVRIAFERLGDHLLANRLLDGLDSVTVVAALGSEGHLAFAVQDTASINEYTGLIEALSIQVPERFGLELPDCIGDDAVRQSLVKNMVMSLPWRDPLMVTERTGELLRYALSFPGFAPRVFDAVLSIGSRQSLVDAFWIHSVLDSRSMAERDTFWCGYLHRGYEENGPLAKLVRAAFEVDVASVPYEIVERWAIMLLWFCAAADRRVRDHATKALVRITESMPMVWKQLIEQFVTVDDEFIIERCFAAAYGALLRARDHAAEMSIATVAYREVFADSTRFQNAAIRDYARLLLELAAHDNVLPEAIIEADYLPPYQSQWPLTFPVKNEIEEYKHSRDEMPSLYFSCMVGDFNRYILNALSDYRQTISREDMARWIFQHVLDLGYTSDRFLNYDGYMVSKYGGGRGKPDWAERVGKKYQWISLARLAARVTDHVSSNEDSWNPKPLRTPLSYPRSRDIDPSLLLQRVAKEKTASWWLPQQYDFEMVSGLTDREWTAIHDDIPDTAAMLLERQDSQGHGWIVLDAFIDWSSKKEDEEHIRSYRNVWLHLHSYLIPRVKEKVCWEWLQNQEFRGGWMPTGAEFYEGLVGEYPWATPFNLYKDSYLSRGGNSRKKLPCTMIPTCNSLSVSHEYDAYQDGGINFYLPARRFFESTSLHWNGTSGYVSNNGEACFIDPSVVEPGRSALLVNPRFLREFLDAHNLTIVWTIFIEKLVINDHQAPRLLYSRAHMLGSDGLLSSAPVTTND